MKTRELTTDERGIIDAANEKYNATMGNAKIASDLQLAGNAWTVYQLTLSNAGIVATLCGYRARVDNAK